MKPTLKPEQELENIKIENASLREKILEKTLELENKSRQLEIEAALEKVRAITMEMRKSDDLQRAANLLFHQVRSLGIPSWSAGYCIWDEDKKGITLWMSSEDVLQPAFHAPLTVDPAFIAMREAYENGLPFYVHEIGGEELVKHYQYMTTLPGIEEVFGVFGEAGIQLPTFQVFHIAFFSRGFLLFITYESIPEAHAIFRRFTTVFEQTYTRFIDLKVAEAQTKEAQIESALERVRSKAMSMEKSDDLASVVAVVFSELDKLELGTMRCGIGTINKELRTTDSWGTTVTDGGLTVAVSGNESMDIHPLLQQAYEAWLRQEDLSYVLEGDDLVKYYEAVATTTYKLPDSQSILDNPTGIKQYYFMAAISSGGLFAFRDRPFPEEDKAIIKRFAGVFGQTYTRFLDLKKAESQAREAQIELGLERVRAKVMSMNNSNDLKETSLVFGDQLKNLGNEWVFSYFWLIDEEKDTHSFWITWPDNSTSLTTYPLHEADPYTIQCLAAWKKGDRMHANHIPVSGIQLFLDTFQQLANDAGQAAIDVLKKRNFPQGAYYYDALMKYGSFGICMNREATDEENKIQCRFAIEFERAYTRYLDLKQAEMFAHQAELDLIKLKEEKLRTEMALTELTATQSKLIQAEKMASLGELTAGIAHEIQNPLNFVNNFSEVSNELLEDMQEELTRGNTADAISIAKDVQQNLEKINHHGKRADAIVKSMLQHSRTGTGKNELTDINAMVDEYLRLAYHGHRAKDKAFNVTLKTEFDDGVGKISILSQDIGRVILNLITNAFYAVSEKKKFQKEGFEPTVYIKTRKLDNSVRISIADNGMGIPNKVLDKIFQPFFTTKPTGQGTGLGLSLSYDIITKGHGGRLDVETKEGEGAEFIILLPTGNIVE